MNRPYPPPHHLSHDRDLLIETVHAFPFALLVSGGAAAQISHAPVVWKPGEAGRTIWLHMDRANPHSDTLDGAAVTAVFRAGDAYITPSMQAPGKLPTWNYAIVEAQGAARRIDQPSAVKAILAAQTAQYEAQWGGDYALDPDGKAVAALLPFITGVEIAVDSLTGRFKLSQDRRAQDKAAGFAALTDGSPGLEAYWTRLRGSIGLEP